MINITALKNAAKNWEKNDPFPHFVVDNFFEENVAKELENEFPNFDDKLWHEYGNAIEVKKVCNNWNIFPKATYSAFNFLNSEEFIELLSKNLFGETILTADSGLNGGGWHIHKKGGKLNTHLDYSLHPKLGMQRKLNIIVYLNSDWRSEWGGSLGLWGNENSDKPGNLVKQIDALFNRAVVFDTTCNSWHGLPEPLKCPEEQYRKSLAVYYLTEAPKDVDQRGKALFAPTDEQKDDPEVLKLIKARSNVDTASSVYTKK